MHWNDLSLKDKSDLMRLYIKNGIYSLEEMKKDFNESSKKYYMGGQLDENPPKIAPFVLGTGFDRYGRSVVTEEDIKTEEQQQKYNQNTWQNVQKAVEKRKQQEGLKTLGIAPLSPSEKSMIKDSNGLIDENSIRTANLREGLHNAAVEKANRDFEFAQIYPHLVGGDRPLEERDIVFDLLSGVPMKGGVLGAKALTKTFRDDFNPIIRSYTYPILHPKKYKEDAEALVNLFNNHKSNYNIINDKKDLIYWLLSPQYKNRFATEAEYKKARDRFITNLNNTQGVKLNYIWEPAKYGKRVKNKSGQYALFEGEPIRFRIPNKNTRGYSGPLLPTPKNIVVFPKNETQNVFYHELSHASDRSGIDIKKLKLGIGNNRNAVVLPITRSDKFKRYLSKPTEIRARVNATATEMLKKGLNPTDPFDLIKHRNDVLFNYLSKYPKKPINSRTIAEADQIFYYTDPHYLLKNLKQEGGYIK